MTKLYSDASQEKPTAAVFAEIWAAIRQLQTARTAEATTIGEGGITIVADDDGEGGTLTIDGGTVRALSAAGVEIFAIFSLFGTRAWKLAYDDGPTAIGTVGNIGNQYVAIWDRSDNAVFSIDGQTGVGLAEPTLNIPMVPSSGTSVVVGGPFWPAFTNVAYQEVMHCITRLWHPRIAVGVNTNASSGTVEWELRIDGTTTLGGASGDTQRTFAIPGWGDTIGPGDQKSVQLWARNTSGVQSRLIVDRCYGTKS